MNDTLREALPIIFMYCCAFLLAPFIAYALYIAFEGDRRNAPVVEATEEPAEATTDETLFAA